MQVYWLKHLTALHSRIAEQFQAMLNKPQIIPNWLLTGRTTLLQKCQEKGPIPENYRPITCLSVVWKLFSGILADKMILHLKEHNILAFEQKGIMPGGRGPKSQLLIDCRV